MSTEVIRGKCKGCGRVLIIETKAGSDRLVTRHEAPLCETFKRLIASSVGKPKRLADYHEKKGKRK